MLVNSLEQRHIRPIVAASAANISFRGPRFPLIRTSTRRTVGSEGVIQSDLKTMESMLALDGIT